VKIRPYPLSTAANSMALNVKGMKMISQSHKSGIRIRGYWAWWALIVLVLV